MPEPIVLLRHGEAESNRGDAFAGTLDVPLTALGRQQASMAARQLLATGFVPSVVLTSPLRRAAETASVVVAGLGLTSPAVVAPELVERHYGALQGRPRAEVVAQFGGHRVDRWRRTWSERPPIAADGRGESLADVHARVARFWETAVAARVAHGERVLVVAHGHVLRALLQHLEALPTDQAARREIPLATPFSPERAGAARPRHTDDDQEVAV